jgi:hypothetical protein
MYEAGEYPFDGKDDRIETGWKFALYQGYLCASPDSNFFAHGSEFCDNLEFFETQKEQSRLLKKYEMYDTTVEFREQRLTITDNTVESYAWAYGTEQYCYFLYCGYTKAESAGKKLFKNHVFVFIGNIFLCRFICRQPSRSENDAKIRSLQRDCTGQRNRPSHIWRGIIHG